jgi:hypothetical protein
MIVLHMKDIQTRYSGLLYERYFYMLFNYFKEKGAKFIEIQKSTEFDNINEDIVIIDPNGQGIKEEMYNVIKIINKYQLNDYKFKMYYICGDIWPVQHTPFLNNIIITLLKSHKVKLIHPYVNLDIISYLWITEFNLKKYIHNYKYLQYNYYYKEMEIEFNPNPKNMVLLSGNMQADIYPERLYLKNINHPKVEELKFNQVSTYIQQLNQYICAFVSNVSHFNTFSKYKTSINVYLLKYFEVLSSGSLLLSDNKVEKELLQLGLKHSENCFISSMENISTSINYITDEKNKEEINRIRLNGYNFYKEYKKRMDIEFNDCFKELI